MPVHSESVLTSKEIESLAKADVGGVTIVKFSASWCRPCSEIEEGFWGCLDDIDTANAGKAPIVVLLVDADKAPDVFTEYEITGMPTLLVCAGKERRILRKPETEELKEEIKRLLPSPELVLDGEF